MLNYSWFQSFVNDPVKRDPIRPILDQFSIITRPYTRPNGLKTIPSTRSNGLKTIPSNRSNGLKTIPFTRPKGLKILPHATNRGLHCKKHKSILFHIFHLLTEKQRECRAKENQVQVPLPSKRTRATSVV